jgi:hypothetical protein
MEITNEASEHSSAQMLAINMGMETSIPQSSFGELQTVPGGTGAYMRLREQLLFKQLSIGLPCGMLGQALENADGAKLALWNPALGTFYLALLFVVGIGDMSSITHQHLSKASMLMPHNSGITDSQVKRVCLRQSCGCLLDTCIRPCPHWCWGCLQTPPHSD